MISIQNKKNILNTFINHISHWSEILKISKSKIISNIFSCHVLFLMFVNPISLRSIPTKVDFLTHFVYFFNYKRDCFRYLKISSMAKMVIDVFYIKLILLGEKNILFHFKAFRFFGHIKNISNSCIFFQYIFMIYKTSR